MEGPRATYRAHLKAACPPWLGVTDQGPARRPWGGQRTQAPSACPGLVPPGPSRQQPSCAWQAGPRERPSLHTALWDVLRPTGTEIKWPSSGLFQTPLVYAPPGEKQTQ